MKLTFTHSEINNAFLPCYLIDVFHMPDATSEDRRAASLARWDHNSGLVNEVDESSDTLTDSQQARYRPLRGRLCRACH